MNNFSLYIPKKEKKNELLITYESLILAILNSSTHSKFTKEILDTKENYQDIIHEIILTKEQYEKYNNYSLSEKQNFLSKVIS